MAANFNLQLFKVAKVQWWPSAFLEVVAWSPISQNRSWITASDINHQYSVFLAHYFKKQTTRRFVLLNRQICSIIVFTSSSFKNMSIYYFNALIPIVEWQHFALSLAIYSQAFSSMEDLCMVKNLLNLVHFLWTQVTDCLIDVNVCVLSWLTLHISRRSILVSLSHQEATSSLS